jgi:D-amino-acid oxidase
MSERSIRPGQTSPHVLVIGAGVSGLTTADCLLSQGFRVTLAADKFAPHITSSVAGALWEWPPAVCGHQHDPAALAREKDWSRISYGTFEELARDPATGVRVRTAIHYFCQPIEQDPENYRKMNDLRPHVREFVHDPALVHKAGVNPHFGVQDAYAHLAPVVDTDVYLAWLMARVLAAGGRVVQHRFDGPLRESAKSLCSEFRVDAIVNCTGLGSADLAGDSMYPLRGALVRVRNDGRRFPRVAEAHCLTQPGAEHGPGFVFIVPRGQDTLVLGGIAEPDKWALDIGMHNYEPVQQIVKRCVDFLPILENAEVDAHEPVRVGLRPFRDRSVRVEREPGTNIVHNYGHGGSGVSLSWGCAREAARVVEDLLKSRA